MFQMIHCEADSFVVIIVSGLFILADRIGITQSRSTRTLCFHISTTHKLHTGDISLFFGIIQDATQIRHTVVAIHLQSCKYDRTFFIVFTHRLVCQFVQSILKTVIFGIHNQTDIILVSTLAESHEAFFKFTESLYFFYGQLTAFL